MIDQSDPYYLDTDTYQCLDKPTTKTLWKQHPEYPQLWISFNGELVIRKRDRYRYYLHPNPLHRPKGYYAVTLKDIHRSKSINKTPMASFKRTDRSTHRNVPMNLLYQDVWSEYPSPYG